MVSPDQLKQKALRDCRKHVEETLKGDFLIDPDASELEWHPRQLRHLFHQKMVVWRKCHAVHVFVDQQNSPVGYMDEEKWMDCDWQPLSRQRILELAAATGYVPASSSLLSLTRGPKNSAEAVLTTRPDKADAPRYFLRVNPSREQVIAIHPIEIPPLPPV